MAKAKILLVEDSKTQAKSVIEFLKKEGYDVIWVEDGKSAISTAKTQPLDLILLDVVLPDLNGKEVCRWLKLNQGTKGIPVIMLTAQGSTPDKVTGLESGADDYVSKPFEEIELNARIYACLRTKALQDELSLKNRQLEELLERVEVLAVTDPLTELFNRRRFETVLNKEFKRTERYKAPLSALMIDIDHFKKINDNHGHHVGDMVLHDLAAILKSAVREIDIIARWGGEEFVVLLPQTDKAAAVKSATRVMGMISSHNFPSIPDKQVTVSIGVASAPSPDIESSEILINACDLAMYEAKKNGRNRVEVA